MNRLNTLLAMKAAALAPNLLANDRLVCCAIIDHFNRKTGRCDPGVQRVSDLLRISPRTVIRSVQRLEKAGLLRKARHGGRGNRNSYEPAWERLAELERGWQRRFKQQGASRQVVSRLPSQASHLPGDNDVTETCLPHLSEETLGRGDTNRQASSKSQGSRLTKRDEIVCPVSIIQKSGRTARDAAATEAQRRWDTDLIGRLAGEPKLYSRVLELVTSDMIEAATSQELRRPGSGADWLLQRIELIDPTIASQLPGKTRMDR